MSLTFIIIAVVVVAIIVMVAKGKIGIANESTIRVADIPAVFSQLRATGSDGSFAVFIPTPEQSDSDESVNVQFSIENASIGLDWVLISSVNIRDQEKFEDIARRSRFNYLETEMNGVRYLRTEDRKSDDLCIKLLSEIYGLTDQDSIGLIIESFEWPATTSRTKQ
jgi:hypothetical protein